MAEQQPSQNPTEFIAGINLHYFWSKIEHAELADGHILLHRKRVEDHAPSWLVQALKFDWAKHGDHGGFSNHVLLVKNSSEGDSTRDSDGDLLIARRSFWAQVAFWLLKPGRLQTSGSSGPVNMSDMPHLSRIQVDWDRAGSWITNRGYPFEEGDIPAYREIWNLSRGSAIAFREKTPGNPSTCPCGLSRRLQTASSHPTLWSMPSLRLKR